MLLVQATVETVIKVSQKQQQEEDDDDDDVDAKDGAANSTEPSLTSLVQEKISGGKSSNKSSNKTAAPAGSKQQKAKGKKVDSHAEKEVDRIIDSQDNEYVLSKPK